MKSLQGGMFIFIFCIYSNYDFGENTWRADDILYFCYVLQFHFFLSKVTYIGMRAALRAFPKGPHWILVPWLGFEPLISHTRDQGC